MEIEHMKKLIYPWQRAKNISKRNWWNNIFLWNTLEIRHRMIIIWYPNQALLVKSVGIKKITATYSPMMRTQNKILLKTAKFSMFPTIIRNFHLPLPSYKCWLFLWCLRKILRAMHRLNDSKRLARYQLLRENLQKQQTQGNFKFTCMIWNYTLQNPRRFLPTWGTVVLDFV